MIILNGKETADRLKQNLKKEIDKIDGNKPVLCCIVVGDNPASKVYVRNKENACVDVGIYSKVIKLPADITEKDLINNIKKLNSDDSITGVIVQLPLPKHIDEQNVINAIDASKDVDGFHPINLGKTLIGMPTIHPATPKGILTLFREYNIDTVGKSIVIIGRSNIVGKPLAAMLMQKGWDATVTLCNSYTNKIDLLDYCYNADIIITAVGIPHFLDKQMISKGVIIIDVGINRIQDENSKTGHKLVGDVNFDDVKNLCDAITPVPGGVGPMTVYSLLENTYNAYINKL